VVIATLSVLFALQLFILIMWARVILDLVRSLNREFRPRSVGLVLAEAVYVVTDPPIKFVRRFVPPLRIGNISLDLSWTIVMLAAIVLSYVVASFT
jgi:YggT family protein